MQLAARDVIGKSPHRRGRRIERAKRGVLVVRQGACPVCKHLDGHEAVAVLHDAELSARRGADLHAVAGLCLEVRVRVHGAVVYLERCSVHGVEPDGEEVIPPCLACVDIVVYCVVASGELDELDVSASVLYQRGALLSGPAHAPENGVLAVVGLYHVRRAVCDEREIAHGCGRFADVGRPATRLRRHVEVGRRPRRSHHGDRSAACLPLPCGKPVARRILAGSPVEGFRQFVGVLHNELARTREQDCRQRHSQDRDQNLLDTVTYVSQRLLPPQ